MVKSTLIIAIIAAVTFCSCSSIRESTEQNSSEHRRVATPKPAVEPTSAATKAPASGRSVTASYYGDEFEGKKTASGETYHSNELTAAHKTLPLGSKVQVKNTKTGEQEVVRINDRGPYAKGRQLDLSKKAAQKIGVTEDGTAKVEIKVVATPTP